MTQLQSCPVERIQHHDNFLEESQLLYAKLHSSLHRKVSGVTQIDPIQCILAKKWLRYNLPATSGAGTRRKQEPAEWPPPTSEQTACTGAASSICNKELKFFKGIWYKQWKVRNVCLEKFALWNF